ncbi:MAG: hypothetical protein DSZ23_03485 [Thermodesulfatator sp.]|nr:MAG: hypothetical protein DSZ23_03485 [Thermodesulfatator sp.]
MAEASQVVDEELEQILDEEAFMILHSGETPEIAYYSSRHFLFEDVDGPRLKPGSVDLSRLKRAVFERYRKILLRDMNPAFRDKRIYRGLARSIANWQRLKTFALKEGFNISEVREEAARHLASFLENEVHELKTGSRKASSINCSWQELKEFASELGIDRSTLPEGIENLCQNT